jgi:5-methylcytosine-specific restriction endonuclease McrA
MSDYSEKLLDPRWQKKRLRILERDAWKCRCCEDDKETLAIHHLIYSKGEPWDAPDETLETLCKTCHDWRETFNKKWGRSMVQTGACQDLLEFIEIGRAHV